MADYLRQFGRKLLASGYEVLPIKAGAKRPPLKNWESIEINARAVDEWLGHPNAAGYGVGVRTALTPAVDLDIRDQEVVDKMVEWCQANIGQTVVRIGSAPKTLLVYRAEKTFTKLSSKKYVDWQGQEHRIEILGHGQQFVAFAIHPDTKKPYHWVGESIADIPADRLPILTAQKAHDLIAYFEASVPSDWEQVTTGRALPALQSQDDNFLANFKPPAQLSTDEIEAELDYIAPDDYETWVQVGMALHHQFQGWHEGWEVWDRWSQKSDKYTSSDDTEAKWESFSANAPGVTIGTVFFLADQGRRAASRARMTQWEAKVQACNDYLVLLNEIAPEIGKQFSYDPGLFDLFTERLKKRAKEITGTPVRVDVIRKAMSPKAGSAKNHRASYDWLDHWVYDLSTDRFFHMEDKSFLSEKAFNAQYDRLLLSDAERADGVATPVNRAAAVALNDAAIPTVAGVRYLPGAGDLFTFDGQQVVNLYKADSGALVPAFQTVAGKEAVRLFEKHMEFLVENTEERAVLVDFLAYVVQNPGKRVKWAVLLQGPEGNGKSYIHGLMGRILGPRNVSAVPGRRLEGQWTDWAEGNMLTCIEEVKFQGHNRFDALNSIKPYITNEVIEITKKYLGSYSAPNTASYLMFTNFQDALPLDSSDSRYYVIFSRLKTKDEVDAFVAANPDYFATLFGGTYPEAGAIRRWLLERDLSTGFNPDRRAPSSAAKAYMVSLAKTDEEHMLEEILDTANEACVTEEVLSSTALLDLWKARYTADRVPQTRRLNHLLVSLGYRKMDFEAGDRIKAGGRYHRIWTKTPDGVTESEVRKRIKAMGQQSEFEDDF